MAGAYFFKLKSKLLYLFFSGLVCLLLSAGAGLPVENKITNHLGMEFIWVKPGSFLMGSPENEPYRDNNETRHTSVIEKGYYLQATEVTVAQWRAVMGKKFFVKKKGGPNFPVVKVSYYDCEKFIKKLNSLNKQTKGTYRMPTEKEWEYACRAGTTTAYSWGDKIDCSKAMYQNNKKKGDDCIGFYKSKGLLPDMPAPVKSFDPNPWGFYDMHGNVWEWCADQYHDYKNPSGTIMTGSRIRRGGSWYKYGVYLRSANRAYAHPAVKFQTTGFRVVFEVDDAD